jgi:hypothetical protein
MCWIERSYADYQWLVEQEKPKFVSELAAR